MEQNHNTQDWYAQFGKKKEECPIFQKILKSEHPYEKKEFKEKDNVHEYYFSYADGISLSFANNTFSSVFLYGKYDKKFQNYKGTLPYSLTFDMNNSDIVSFLGEPNSKSGGRTVPISISYERLGIEFTFLSPVWDLVDNKISFICLFPPRKTEENTICGVCAKRSSLLCGQCGLVSYCSPNCQKIHWKVHKINCKKYSENKK